MTIWMITGLHKPRWTESVLRNFSRQTYTDKRLIVVFNGECAEMPINSWFSNVHLLRSSADPAAVMNVALHELRYQAEPTDWFCKCDADDYYGPDYLQRVSEHTDADYSGIKSVYVKSQDGTLWFAAGNATTTIVHGPTIAGRIGSALNFTEGLDWGEDTLWCQQMEMAGRSCAIRPWSGFCYQRWPNYEHTWPCTDEELIAAWPIPMYELGAFDENVINGITPHKHSKALKAREGNECSMPIRILLQRLQEKECMP